ncbi:hypothetical protein [Bradyrhizobium sp. B117]|uniref:hypothetical protein n=1 Tax=Bradyrhizobium sp. B117 TaxID=3140246 RepID=UPI00318381E7
MHEQINRDEDCTFIAEEIMKMRGVMSELAKERRLLGDTDPIVVASLFYPPPTAWLSCVRVAERHLMPGTSRM